VFKGLLGDSAIKVDLHDRASLGFPVDHLDLVVEVVPILDFEEGAAVELLQLVFLRFPFLLAHEEGLVSAIFDFVHQAVVCDQLSTEIAVVVGVLDPDDVPCRKKTTVIQEGPLEDDGEGDVSDFVLHSVAFL